MKKRLVAALYGLLAIVLLGCGNSGGGVDPIQTQNKPMTAGKAADLSKPDPSLTPEQNAAKAQMAQDQLKRDEYYSKRYGSTSGGK